MTDEATARTEVLVEPFRVNEPGPHVIAALDALTEAGLAPDMGPFATVAEGDLSVTIEAVARLLHASFEAGADAVQVRVERVDTSRDSPGG